MKRGLKFKNKSEPGYHAILLAVNIGDLDMFKLLVENGADLNAGFTNKEGWIMSIPAIIERRNFKNILQYMLTIKNKFSSEKQKQIDNMRIRMLFK